MKKKQPQHQQTKKMVQKEIIDQYFRFTALSIIDYANAILEADNMDEESDLMMMADRSDLYLNIDWKGEVSDVMVVCGEYFDAIYCHLAFYVHKESYDKAALIRSASEAEIEFIYPLIYKHFGEQIADDFSALRNKFIEFYL